MTIMAFEWKNFVMIFIVQAVTNISNFGYYVKTLRQSEILKRNEERKETQRNRKKIQMMM